MSTLAERIQEIIAAGHTQIELARAADVTKGTANQWLDGGIKSIKLEYAQGIERLTGYSAEWLVTGKGEKKATGIRAVAPLQASVDKKPNMDDVIELLALFDQASAEGRKTILDLARSAADLAQSNWRRVVGNKG